MLQIKAKIVYNKRVCENYFRLFIEADKIIREVHPGQFVNIRVNDSYEQLLRRPLSIHRVGSRANTEHRTPNTAEVLYEVVGKGTEILSQKKAGEYLDIIGPLGNGFSIPDSRFPILVGGGIGIAPLLFLAEQTRIQHPASSIQIVIGAKTKNEILCEREFRDLGCGVKIATDDGSVGFKGKVTELLDKILASGFRLQASGKNIRAACSVQRAALIYACGPRPMLKEISRISKKYNIAAQASLEEHMACGIGVCLGCVVNTKDGFKRVCKEGPVFNADEIIW